MDIGDNVQNRVLLLFLTVYQLYSEAVEKIDFKRNENRRESPIVRLVTQNGAEMHRPRFET